MPEWLTKLLTKIEQRFSFDAHYVFKGGFWLAMTQIIASASSLILAISFANLLPKESYGIYRYAISLSGIIGALSLSGLATAIVQSVARGYEGIVRKAFWINLRWSGFIYIVAAASALYYFWNDNSTLFVSLLIIGFFLPLLNSALFYKSFLNGRKLFKTTASYSLIYNTLPVLILIGTAWVTDNPIALVLAFFAGNTLISVSLYLYTLRTYRPNVEFDPKSISFSKHLSLVNLLDVVGTHIDKIFVFNQLGAVALASYTFATAVPEQIRNALKNIPALATPRFANRTKTEIKDTIYSKIFTLMVVTVPIVIVYILIAPWIYKFFFPQYLESIPYSQVFALILLAEGGLAGAALKAQMAIRETYILNIVGNLFKIGLMLSLPFFYGIWGIIIARLVARLGNFLLSLYLVKRF